MKITKKILLLGFVMLFAVGINAGISTALDSDLMDRFFTSETETIQPEQQLIASGFPIFPAFPRPGGSDKNEESEESED